MRIRYQKQFFLSFLFAFLCYGTYVYPHYSQDVYAKAYAADPGITLEFVLESGRFAYGFFNNVLTSVTGTNIPISICFRIFPIVMFALIIYQAFCIVVHKKESSALEKSIDFISVCLIFLNPLFADWFQFPECIPLYTLGILGAIWSSVILFSPSVKYPTAGSIVVLTLSVGIYQPVILYFVLFVLIQAWNWCLNTDRQDLIKGLTVKIITALLSYASASIVQIAIVNLGNRSGVTRVNANIGHNLSVVLSAQKELWLMENTGKANWGYFLAFLIVCVISILVFTVGIRKRKNSILLAGIFIVFTAAFYLAIFVTHIFIEPWVSQRTITGFLAVVPFMVIMLLSLLQDYKVSFWIHKVVVGVLLVLSGLFLYRTNALSLDLIKTNVMDQQLARLVVNYVEEYEENSGIKVDTLAYCNDENVTWAYDGIYCGYDLNVRGWAKNWCICPMIQFYTGRSFQEVEMPEKIYQEQFSGKDWNDFRYEQIYIQDHTLYLCVF